MKLKSNVMITLQLLAAVFILSSATCGVSLSGTSIDPNILSVSVSYFPNQSSFVAPTLSQTFTETLKDKFIRESRLLLKDNNADWEFSGAIVNYTSSPIAPTGNETTALNRLTIGVKVDFINNKNETENWQQTFSRYQDYSSGQSLSQVENDLIQSISEQIADDVFLKVAGNW